MKSKRYSIRLLLLFITGCAVLAELVAWHMDIARGERAARAAVLNGGGMVADDSYWRPSRVPALALKLFGPEHFLPVKQVAALPEKLTDDDLTKLAALRHLEGIATNRILNPRGRLSETHELTHLSALAPLISDRGIQQLSGTPSLEALVLYNTSVTDDGIASLAQLPALKVIHVQSKHITDGAIPHFCKMKSLEHLSTFGTSITEPGIVKLRTCLPNCVVQPEAFGEPGTVSPAAE